MTISWAYGGDGVGPEHRVGSDVVDGVRTALAVGAVLARAVQARPLMKHNPASPHISHALGGQVELRLVDILQGVGVGDEAALVGAGDVAQRPVIRV